MSSGEVYRKIIHIYHCQPGFIQLGLTCLYTHAKQTTGLASIWKVCPATLTQTASFQRSPLHRALVPVAAVSGALQTHEHHRHGSGALGGWCRPRRSDGSWSNQQQRERSRLQRLHRLVACRRRRGRAVSKNIPSGNSSGGILRTRRSLCETVWAVIVRCQSAFPFSPGAPPGPYRA